MKEKIIATDNNHLKLIIKNEINQCGNECDLNHIDISSVTYMSHLFFSSEFNGDISKWDVSSVTNMSYLFEKSKFNGDISKWDVSNVTSMSCLFYESKFNGDISKWNVSKVTDMYCLFYNSKFDGDISNWDVSNVTNMSCLFSKSAFTGDISSWRPLKLEYTEYMFANCKAPIPYWFGKDNIEILKKIGSYDLFNKMNSELIDSSGNNKKLKI